MPGQKVITKKKGKLMDCTTVRELITPYVDAELAAETTTQIDKHLKSCEDCRLEMQAQMSVKRLLSEKLKKVTADDELKEQVIKNTIGRDTSQSFWLFRKLEFELRPITGLAIAAMLLLAVLSKDIFLDQNYGQFPAGNNSFLTATGEGQLGDGLQASVVGRVVCVGCYLKDKYHAHHDCQLHGHRYGFLTTDGNVWNFTHRPESDKLMTSGNMAGKLVKVEGNIFYSAHFIDVDNYELVSDN